MLFNEARRFSKEHVDTLSKHQPMQSQPPQSGLLCHSAAEKSVSGHDIQYADYVNQSKIQAMIEANKKP